MNRGTQRVQQGTADLSEDAGLGGCGEESYLVPLGRNCHDERLAQCNNAAMDVDPHEQPAGTL